MELERTGRPNRALRIGKTLTVRGIAVIEIRGDKISRNADFWDLTTALRQLLPEGQECVAGLVGLSE
jgi:hypothetical protein